MGAGRGELPLWAVLAVSAGVLLLGFRGGEKVVRAGGSGGKGPEGIMHLAAASPGDGSPGATATGDSAELRNGVSVGDGGRALLAGSAALGSSHADEGQDDSEHNRSSDEAAAGHTPGTWPPVGASGPDGGVGAAFDSRTQGLRVAYLPNAFGLLEEGPFQNGVRHGDWQIRRSSDGTLRSAGRYDHGLRDGVWETYAPDGQVLEELGYFAGSRHGHFRAYSPDGVLVQDGQFEDNSESGEWVTYYSGGRIKARGRYENGLREGAWEFYDDLGIPMEMAGMYRAGIRIGDL